MLINLVPEFLAVAESGDPVAAYAEYFAAHEPMLRAYNPLNLRLALRAGSRATLADGRAFAQDARLG